MMVMKKTLNPARNVRRIFLSSLLAGCLLSISALAQAAAAAPAAPQQPSSSELRDGQHDFDFNICTWKTHIRRRLHPLTGSNDWLDLTGTVDIRADWNGS